MGGTTCFNDMYWHLEGTAKAVSDSGMRGVLSSVFIDRFGNEDPSALRKRTLAQFRDIDAGTRVSLALGPHAIYTVTEEGLMWIKEYSDKHDMLMHFHLSETKKEVDDCIKAHGKRPVEYLAEIGFLGPNLVCAHCVWLSDGEMDLLAKNKVKVSHCPTSNMKLSVGGVLAYEKLRARGVSVSLGTDGCASNNSLDMFQAMKSAALLHKHSANNPTVLSAADAFNMATQEGARALKLDAGRIAEGALADIILIDLKRPEMTPLHNLTSNMVYSASGNCVDTVICDGKIIMEAKTVKMQETIMQKASQAADCLTKRK
jgi:5-methylthioadenosine/S-adenosylhomocysteine deaminase